MNQSTKQLLKRLTGLYSAARWIDVRNNDLFLVSYPKSGNTWLRFLVANLIIGERYPIDLTNIESIIPDIYLHSIYYFHKLPSPRFLKSHECFDPRYKKVIYIVRDPRDTVLSFRQYKIKKGYISENFALDEFVDEFLKGEVSVFGSWGEHVGCWLGAREKDRNFLMIRYEDLAADPQREGLKIARFIGLSTSLEEVDKAVDRSSFPKLQAMEKKQGARWKALKGFGNQSMFFRNGQSGNWRSNLPDHLAKVISVKWERLLERLDYPIL